VRGADGYLSSDEDKPPQPDLDELEQIYIDFPDMKQLTDECDKHFQNFHHRYYKY